MRDMYSIRRIAALAPRLPLTLSCSFSQTAALNIRHERSRKVRRKKGDGLAAKAKLRWIVRLNRIPIRVQSLGITIHKLFAYGGACRGDGNNGGSNGGRLRSQHDKRRRQRRLCRSAYALMAFAVRAQAIRRCVNMMYGKEHTEAPTQLG